MAKCHYCKKEKNEKELVPLGEHFAINDFQGRVEWRWICAPEMGCQKSDEATWGFYFFGTLFYDLPFFIFGVLMITAIHYILFPTIEKTFLLDAWKWEAAFCGIFIGTPILFSWVLGLPILLSPILLILFSIWIIP